MIIYVLRGMMSDLQTLFLCRGSLTAGTSLGTLARRSLLGRAVEAVYVTLVQLERMAPYGGCSVGQCVQLCSRLGGYIGETPLAPAGAVWESGHAKSWDCI